MARIIRLPRPDEDDERDIVWSIHHNCQQARALRSALEDEDVDLVHFAFGVQGWGFPSNTPFELIAANACEACGAWLRCWGEWVAPRIWTPGSAA